MARVYLGRLPARCSERDIEKFFKGYGRLRDVVMKSDYAFVEFENDRDADDAVYELNGKDMIGERVIVEHARHPMGGRGFSRGGRDFGGGGGRRAGGRERYDPPTRTEYRAIVKNLSSKASWQDLKDLMRKAGDVSYADAHKAVQNEGIVEFSCSKDLRKAVDKFDGYELHGRTIKVYEERSRRKDSYRGRSRSRSVSRRSRRSNSRSVSGSRSRSRSRSRSKSKSLVSKRRRSASSQKSREHSKRKAGSSRSSSRGSRKRSPSNRNRGSKVNGKSRSPSPNKDAEKPLERSKSERSRSASKDGSASQKSRSGSRSRSASPTERSRSRSAERSRSGDED